MLDCPVCHSAVDGLVCGKCGHRDPKAPQSAAVDSRHRIIVMHGKEIGVNLCDFMVRGEPCNDIAVWSPNGNGQGPWYCRKHSRPAGSEIAPEDRESGRAVLRQLVASAANHFRPREPGED